MRLESLGQRTKKREMRDMKVWGRERAGKKRQIKEGKRDE